MRRFWSLCFALSGRTRPDHVVPEAYAGACMHLLVVWFAGRNVSSLLLAWESDAGLHWLHRYPSSLAALCLRMLSMIETPLEHAREYDA